MDKPSYPAALSTTGVAGRLIANWVYGGFLAGWLLLVLTPLLRTAWPAPVADVYLLLPVYMLHQFEEHDDDRFRRFVNALFGGERLTKSDVFLINVPGVWGLGAASLLLAAFAAPGFGLIQAYLVLVNALVHIGQALRLKRYNPGLVTAVVLFLPFGFYALAEINRAGGGTIGLHALGLIVAIAVHAGIVALVLSRGGFPEPKGSGSLQP